MSGGRECTSKEDNSNKKKPSETKKTRRRYDETSDRKAGGKARGLDVGESNNATLSVSSVT